MFASPHPGISQRYAAGLFHGVTHSKRKKRCFSMKYNIETQKPNVHRKNLQSDILGKTFRIWISMKARRCIMKAGSLDKYLLNSNQRYIDSPFGQYLRNLIVKKKNFDHKVATGQPVLDGEAFVMPATFPGQVKQKKNKKTKVWDYKNTPTVYQNVENRMKYDPVDFYVKAPSEMSRYELAELEDEMQAVALELDDYVDDEEIVKIP
jgi:ribosomal protein L28